MAEISRVLILVLIIHSAGMLASFLRSTIMGAAGERVVARLRNTLYGSILKQGAFWLRAFNIRMVRYQIHEVTLYLNVSCVHYSVLTHHVLYPPTMVRTMCNGDLFQKLPSLMSIRLAKWLVVWDLIPLSSKQRVVSPFLNVFWDL